MDCFLVSLLGVALPEAYQQPEAGTWSWRRVWGGGGGLSRDAETEIPVFLRLPHTLAFPGSPQAWHLPSALRFWVRAPGLVASDAGHPWSLLIKM